jgi:hypothetical protein
MTTDFYKLVVMMFSIIWLDGCTPIPQYRVMLQRDGESDGYTLRADNGTGKLSELRYSAWSSHLLKRLERDDIFMLDRLEDGEAPVFFDLFQNGKRYLLIQDSAGGARGPFHLRVIEFDSNGWRQLYYGPCDENPVLYDTDHDGRLEFCYFDCYSSPLPSVFGELNGVLLLEYTEGRLQPTLRLNRKPPMTPEGLLELKTRYREFIREAEATSTERREVIQAYFIKSVLIDLLYEGNWNQRERILLHLKVDPQTGTNQEAEIIRELKTSPYREFVMQLNGKTEKDVLK